MDVYGRLWMFVDVYGGLWMFMDVYGCLWMFMDVYSHLFHRNSSGIILPNVGDQTNYLDHNTMFEPWSRAQVKEVWRPKGIKVWPSASKQ